MKRLFAFVFLALFSLGSFAQFRDQSAYESLYDSESVSSLRSHVGYIASAQMEGRKAGSEGEKMTAEYLFECLEGVGVNMLCGKEGETFGISRDGTDTLVSRNVYGVVEGYDKALRDHFIVIGARMDNLGTHTMTVNGEPVRNIYYGANGNASGLAVMIELAKKVAAHSVMFRRSILFVGFGASNESMAGSWYFLNRTIPETSIKIDAMVNLDMLGVPGEDGFYAYTASNTDMNAILSTAAGQLQPVVPKLTAAEPYPSDHRAFYSGEIPAVMFTTGRYSEHNSPKDSPSLLDYDFMEKEVEYLFNFSQTLANTNHTLLFRTEQEQVDETFDDVYSYYDCDTKPMFLNSPDLSVFMSKWVYQYLKYPEEAVQNGIQGTVQVRFIIEKNGAVSNVQVVRGIDELLDNEAVRVISASPKWRAARVRGQKVRSSMTIGVEFRLARKGEKKHFGINGYNIN